MAKQVPQPKILPAPDVDAWITNGIVTEPTPALAVPSPSTPSVVANNRHERPSTVAVDSDRRCTFELAESRYRALKIHAAKTGMRMQDIFVDAMVQWLDQHVPT